MVAVRSWDKEAATKYRQPERTYLATDSGVTFQVSELYSRLLSSGSKDDDGIGQVRMADRESQQQSMEVKRSSVIRSWDFIRLLQLTLQQRLLYETGVLQ